MKYSVDWDDLKKQLETKIYPNIAYDLENSLKDKLGKKSLPNAYPPEDATEILPVSHGIFNQNLLGNLKVRYEDGDFNIYAPDYALYLEYGTPNPTTADEIMDWVVRKFKLHGGSKKAQKAKLRLAENIAKHITTYGPRAFPFIRTTLHNDLPKIVKKYL